MDRSTIILAIAAVAVVLALLFLLLRGRRQHVAFDALAEPPAPAPARPLAPAAPPVARAAVPAEGHGVGSEVAAAIEDVVDQFVGIDAHPSGKAPGPAHGDALTTLKGLGPKAESRLHELGVTTFEQIAAWQPTDVAAIDAQMGAFKGRIIRDRWVEQARLLTKGDTAAFEAAFGKLG